MQPAVSFDCCRNQIFYISLVGHIGLHKNGFAAIAFDRLDCFRPCNVDVADHNLRAALCKQYRGSTANASSSARD
jgi:hypothetical protein